MRTLNAFLVILAASVGAFGCGGPVAGEKCSTSAYACADETTALECREGAWRALPCKGAGGCAVVGGNVKCDVTRNQPNDACAQSNEGEGICDPSGAATLECRQGTFVRTNTCASCTVAGDQIICTQ